MIGDIIRVSENAVRLCCFGKKCPTVTDLGNGTVEIVDDYGNKVIMKKEEALLLIPCTKYPFSNNNSAKYEPS